MNKILGAIVSIAVLACVVLTVTLYMYPKVSTNTNIGGVSQSAQAIQHIELKDTLPSISNSAMVYKVDKPVVDQQYIKHYTNLFGLNDNITSGTGSNGERIISDGDKNLEIYKAGGFYYYVSSKMGTITEPTNLPSKDEAIKLAENYLKSNQLLPGDVETVTVTPIIVKVYDSRNHTVVKNITTDWVIGFDRKIDGCDVVGPGHHMGVYIGDNGEVVLVTKVWRDITPYKKMNLKSFDKAYSELTAGKSISSQASGNGNKAVITNISIGYFMDSVYSDQSYVEPVYIFNGDVYNDNTMVQPSGYTGYVSALENESELPINS